MGSFFVYNEADTKNSAHAGNAIAGNIFAGQCFWSEKHSRVTSIFTYDNEYLSARDCWSIDPAMALTSGSQPSATSLPGAFRDAAPDRWGQTLIRHRHLRESRERGIHLRNLNEVDYLLGVDDSSRQGSLRFALEKGGAFLHPSNDVPKLVALPKLLDAAHRYAARQDESAISYLLEAGSASLGGARPKAAVQDGADLYIAKFPHRQDAWDVISWEWVALKVAAEAGIRVPENRLINIEGQNLLLVKRFDRDERKRIGYISMMTLLGLTDGEQADYFDIAGKLRDVSTCAKGDLEELFRRVVLSLMLNNTDDHLRNHGLLRSGCGWRLSPVFDVNPNLDAAAIRCTGVFAEFEKESALAAMSSNADAFCLAQSEADRIISEIKAAAKACGKYARSAGIPGPERENMLRALDL
ncbi:MAG: HipA domain-containing protein [Oscillospiraceae bacterium]|jgi:serine/threonine-protein kinase HipA|nr:HipA domain-containing protein [Oscillospiraceae bacterium]